MTMGRGTLSVEEKIAFLQAAVRGRETEYPRRRDIWFPDFSKPRIGEAMEYLLRSMASPFWQSSGVPLSILPDDNRQAYEHVLRYKLRVVWHRAIAGNNNPQAAAAHLCTETRGFEYFIHEGTLTTLGLWCKKTDDALRWLENNTHKLRLCGIADCKYRYFIVTSTRKKYCSKYCQNTAEIARSKKRVRIGAEAKKAAELLQGKGTNKPRLSPEGRERIVRAAKAMSERRRLEKQRNYLF